ncbi:MAG: hypothetical protein CRN43_02965 [Candidatus Nephrothrix sp. EaCA]|nr:MAG: hypothetical protein CRN43_02965 [Candidatus Nephrothrix sp. EaCA]
MFHLLIIFIGKFMISPVKQFNIFDSRVMEYINSLVYIFYFHFFLLIIATKFFSFFNSIIILKQETFSFQPIFCCLAFIIP